MAETAQAPEWIAWGKPNMTIVRVEAISWMYMRQDGADIYMNTGRTLQVSLEYLATVIQQLEKAGVRMSATITVREVPEEGQSDK
jgi:hypothetical protein